MYRFLDRPVSGLDEPLGFLLGAMRSWVGAARGGRCPCRALLQGFVQRGVPEAVRDFGMAMATIDREALGALRFATGGATIGDDEARVLALFDAGLACAPDRVRRIAATIVAEDAAARLATAVEWVALRLSGGTFVERDA